MKIAFACSYFEGDQLDSVTTSFFRRVIKTLVRQGHEVIVLALSEHGESEALKDGARIITRHLKVGRYRNLADLGFAPAFTWSLSRAIEMYRGFDDILNTFSPDVVICVKALDGFLWAAERRFPVANLSVTPQFEIMRRNFDGSLTGFDIEAVSALEMVALSMMNAVSTPSRELAALISQAAGMALEEIDVYNMPVDISSPESCTSDRKRSGVPELVYVGAVEKYKGVDVLIEALPAVAARFPEFRLRIAGEEPSAPGQESTLADQLRAQLREMGLSDRVEFQEAPPDAQRPVLFQSADIVVFPFRYCGCMYHLTEAMASGGCVLSAQVGSIAENIEHGVTGWLVPPENSPALAEAIIGLAENEALRRRLATAATEFAQNLCSYDVAGTKIDALCTRALDNFKTRTQSDTRNMANIINQCLAVLDDFCSTAYMADLLKEKFAEGASSSWTNGYQKGMADAGTAVPTAVKSAIQLVKQLSGKAH